MCTYIIISCCVYPSEYELNVCSITLCFSFSYYYSKLGAGRNNTYSPKIDVNRFLRVSKIFILAIFSVSVPSNFQREM